MIDKILTPAIAQPIEAVGNVLDELFTSDDERLDKKIILQRLAMQPQIAQTEIAKLEASHRSLFVAGWRPFIGWVCGITLAYSYILRDIMIWLFDAQGMPALDHETLTTLLYALLGLGGFRSLEKIQGRSK